MSVLELSAFAIVFLLAFTLALLLTPLAIHLSYRVGAVTTPGGRRHEAQPMPRLGGLPIFGAFTLAVLAAQLMPVPRFDAYEIVRLTGLIAGGSIIFIVGILDDIYEFGWLPQYLGQIAAAGIAIFFQIFIEYFTNPLNGQPTDAWSHLVTVALSMFWLGLMVNTVNFLDGLDGLSCGVALIAGVMLFLNSAFRLNPPQISVSLLPLALIGTCLGFLLYNFSPSRIYLGGGAPFLGFALGALSIIGGAKMATILLVMGLPLMDFAWQVFNRLLRGKNPMQGDRGHFHHRLLDSGRLTQRQIVLGYYGFCSFFGLLTLILESQLFKFVAFGVMLLLIALAFAIVTRLRIAYTSSSSSSSKSSSSSSMPLS
jgi:UDP-GlcNAc:undecaprenyl-phosphate/decaprenyl-phosphate GlcNAc-1-phosphate transferase